ncbi:hypothetical protein [Haematobacter sp. UBA3484]|uniref:hypothetical protein n=1 Tax=Haematobacter sp. UBA3484 TaxID=1946582 RepID=UPI0025C17A67|nr:hypothetical protein [Haematobacter sp. UBA3484]
MKAFALAAVACLGIAGQAEAAIIRYDFTWVESVMDPEFHGFLSRGGGRLIVDESLFPGGTLSGATLRFSATGFSGNVAKVSVTSPRADYVKEGSPPNPSMLLEEIGVETSGFPDQYAVTPSDEFTVIFDDDSNPTAWYGSFITGGSLDATFGNHCDCDWVFDILDPVTGLPYDDPSEAADGTFVKTILDPNPAPVPLPAAAPLLLAGTASLWAISRRRQRVTDR